MDYNLHFESFGEMLQYSQKPSPWYGARASQEIGNREFRGTNSFGEALRLARTGWPEGVDMMSKAMASMPHKPFTHPSRDYDVAGAYPDIGRACVGDPLNMVIHTAPEQSARPVVRLWVAMGSSSRNTISETTNRGAAILSIIDSLEAGGQSIELSINIVCESRTKERLSIHCIVKQAGEPLDIDKMAFVFVNPSLNRRIARGVQETIKAWEYVDGYGTPVDLREEEILSGVVYFRTLRYGLSGFDTPSQAQETIKKQLADYGITVQF